MKALYFNKLSSKKSNNKLKDKTESTEISLKYSKD